MAKKSRTKARNSSSPVAKIISKWYYSPNSPAYLASAAQLYKTLKRDGTRPGNKSITLQQVKDFLEDQEPHQLHRKFRRTKRFKARVSKCVPIGLHTDHQCDLADMHNVSKSNSGANWILVCVDVLSRMADATPLKSKSAKDVVSGFKRIYEKKKGAILPFPWRLYSE